MKALTRTQTAHGLAYHRAGSGPPLLFLHGVGLRAESWHPQVTHFSRAYSVYALDLPGHGESAPLETHTPGVGDYSAKVATFIRSTFTQPVTLIGHSLGALITLDIALQSPELCKAVIAMSPIFERSEAALKAVRARALYIRDHPDQDLASGPIARWFPNTECAAAQLCRAMIESNSATGYAAAYWAFANSRGVERQGVTEMQTPALFLTGERDINSTPDMAQALAKLSISGSAAVIKEARHMVQLSHSEDTHIALDAFLKTAHNM